MSADSHVIYLDKKFKVFDSFLRVHLFCRVSTGKQESPMTVVSGKSRVSLD